jgi:hypothetical protein
MCGVTMGDRNDAVQRDSALRSTLGHWLRPGLTGE